MQSASFRLNDEPSTLSGTAWRESLALWGTGRLSCLHLGAIGFLALFILFLPGVVAILFMWPAKKKCLSLQEMPQSQEKRDAQNWQRLLLQSVLQAFEPK
jgi:hypothetical protein